jgi:hypothetical protein
MKPPACSELALGVATHDERILRGNLLRSPLAERVPVYVERDAPSAAIAYNRILDASDAEFVIFAHHDVYLPRGWEELLCHRLADLTTRDPSWALAGAYGVAEAGTGYGAVWSTSLGRVVHRVPTTPMLVQSFDELLIVVRRGTGLRFDEAMTGFHLYGTEIVQQARARGLNSYALALPLVHNDRFHESLDATFTRAYRFVQTKWREHLPLQTPVIKITRSGFSLLRATWHSKRSLPIRQEMARPVDIDPSFYAAVCGWNDLTPRAQELSPRPLLAQP